MAIRVPTTTQRSVREQATPGVALRSSQPTGYEGLADMGRAIESVGRTAFGVFEREADEANKTAVAHAAAEFSAASATTIDGMAKPGEIRGDGIAVQNENSVKAVNESFNNAHAKLANEAQRKMFAAHVGPSLVSTVGRVNAMTSSAIRADRVITHTEAKDVAIRDHSEAAYDAISTGDPTRAVDASTSIKVAIGRAVDAAAAQAGVTVEEMDKGQVVKIALATRKEVLFEGIKSAAQRDPTVALTMLRGSKDAFEPAEIAEAEQRLMKPVAARVAADAGDFAIANAVASGIKQNEPWRIAEESRKSAVLAASAKASKMYPGNDEAQKMFIEAASASADKLTTALAQKNRNSALEMAEKLDSRALKQGTQPSEVEFLQIEDLDMGVANQMRARYAESKKNGGKQSAGGMRGNDAYIHMRAAINSGDEVTRDLARKAMAGLVDPATKRPYEFPGMPGFTPSKSALMQAGVTEDDVDRLYGDMRPGAKVMADPDQHKIAVDLLTSKSDDQPTRLAAERFYLDMMTNTPEGMAIWNYEKGIKASGAQMYATLVATGWDKKWKEYNKTLIGLDADFTKSTDPQRVPVDQMISIGSPALANEKIRQQAEAQAKANGTDFASQFWRGVTIGAAPIGLGEGF